MAVRGASLVYSAHWLSPAIRFTLKVSDQKREMTELFLKELIFSNFSLLQSTNQDRPCICPLQCHPMLVM